MQNSSIAGGSTYYTVSYLRPGNSSYNVSVTATNSAASSNVKKSIKTAEIGKDR